MSFFQSNIAPRLALMRTALARRFIYDDLVSMTRAYGMDYQDLSANLGPIDLANRVFTADPAPDFSTLLGSPEAFTPNRAPSLFNSEPSVARFLAQLVFHRRAHTIIELGCFVGWTTAHLAAAMRATGVNGRIHALDYMQDYLDVMHGNLSRHQLDHLVSPIKGLSLDPHILAALPSAADIIFIDTSHAYPDTRDEILAYAPRLAPGGCIVLHDSISAPGVRRSIFELRDQFDMHTFATERSNGVTVLFRK
jgi:predicted O-methyltransferase YrrM